MKVTLFGTRGSMSVSSPQTVRYGGNTTCLEIHSECLPKGMALAVDAGTGLPPLSGRALGRGLKNLVVLMTHYHHDHTQGVTMAAHTFAGEEVVIFGPEDHGVGPKQVMECLMVEPLFPVNFGKLAHRFKCKPMKNIGTEVLIIHPVEGVHKISVSEYNKARVSGSNGRVCNGKCLLVECLVVLMYRTTHPEQTISYRFVEMPTGKVFVFLTDHESTAGLPTDLRRHVADADLLVADGQYAQQVYENHTAGFGHATPEYCALLAHRAGVKRLGITHHDPNASDEDVDARVAEAKAEAVRLGNQGLADNTFGCACYQEIEI